jgi:hypothetical protein
MATWFCTQTATTTPPLVEFFPAVLTRHLAILEELAAMRAFQFVRSSAECFMRHPNGRVCVSLHELEPSTKQSLRAPLVVGQLAAPLALPPAHTDAASFSRSWSLVSSSSSATTRPTRSGSFFTSSASIAGSVVFFAASTFKP